MKVNFKSNIHISDMIKYVWYKCKNKHSGVERLVYWWGLDVCCHNNCVIYMNDEGVVSYDTYHTFVRDYEIIGEVESVDVKFRLTS